MLSAPDMAAKSWRQAVGLIFVIALYSNALSTQPRYHNHNNGVGQDTILQRLISLRSQSLSSPSDADKIKGNHKFSQALHGYLSDSVNFRKNLSAIAKIGSLYAPDSSFRLIIWNITIEKEKHIHGGLLVHQPEKKMKKPLFTLHDQSSSTRAAESKTLSTKNWYGALYYDVISFPKDPKRYYLLGWNGRDIMTNEKILDVLSFASDGTPRFGASLFRLGNKTHKRLIFRHAQSASMTLSYHTNKQRFVFDHLGPSDEKFKGQPAYYGPDFTFDALRWKKGKWVLQSNVDVRNAKPNKEMPFLDPRRSKNK